MLSSRNSIIEALRGFGQLSDDDKLRRMSEAVAAAESPLRDHLLLGYAQLADSLGRSEIVERALHQILFDPRSDIAAPLAVERLAHYFTGPPAPLRPENMDHPRLALISQMSATERLCLYSLVVSLAPQRVLEIGRARGGSTLVFAAALQNVPRSKFVSLDPNSLPEHSIHRDLRSRLASQVVFIDGCSPADNPQCCAAAGGRFDLVFIDACHYYEACLADIEGILPFLTENAVIMLHDAHFLGVKQAIKTALENESSLVDCGLISAGANYALMHHTYQGQPSVFRGIHMLRFRPTANAASVPGKKSAGTSRQGKQTKQKLKELRTELRQANRDFGSLKKRVRKSAGLAGRVSQLVRRVWGKAA